MSTSLDMTIVFHAKLYSRLIGIQSNLRRKKLHRTNQGFNFLGGTFSNREYLIFNPESNLEVKVNSSILKDDFSSRTDPFIFTSIASVFLDQSHKASYVLPALKTTSYFLLESSVLKIRFKFKSQF